eukprot:gene13712-13827_t
MRRLPSEPAAQRAAPLAVGRPSTLNGAMSKVGLMARKAKLARVLPSCPR